MNYKHKCKGVCSNHVTFDLEDGILKNVSFSSGCDGNLQGIGALVEGQPALDIVSRIKGICCGGKSTSCPDQLAIGILAALEEQKK